MMYGAYIYQRGVQYRPSVVIAKSSDEARAIAYTLGHLPRTIFPLPRGQMTPEERRALDHMNDCHA